MCLSASRCRNVVFQLCAFLTPFSLITMDYITSGMKRGNVRVCVCTCVSGVCRGLGDALTNPAEKMHLMMQAISIEYGDVQCK